MPSPFKLGVVVGAHREPQQLAVLLRALRHPQVNIYLHIDQRVEIEPFHTAFADAGVGEIHWLTRTRTPWGTDRMVHVELEGMRRALTDDCSYVTIISGQDFPLRPVEEIVDFFEQNRERTYIAYLRLPHDDWMLGGRVRTDFYTYVLFGRPYTSFPRREDTRELIAGFNLKGRLLNLALRAWTLTKPPRSFPPYLAPVGGEHWMNLSREATQYTLSFLTQHPDYASYHRHTASATELFIQSIVCGSDFGQTHEIVNDDLRFILWDGTDSYHPKTLTLDDLPEMAASSDLFARKISAAHDRALFTALRQRLDI